MHIPPPIRIVFCILLLAATGLAHGQAAQRPSGDFAATFISQRSLNAETGQNFWMEGGSAEFGVNFSHGWGVAADYTGTHTGAVGSSNVPLTLSVVTFGPRYRWHANHRFSVYGEGLLGIAHGSDSVFPTVVNSVPSANSFALQVDGGLDYQLTHHFAVRALDVGYLRTTLPNATNNEQNTLRLGAGIVFRFGL